MLFVIVTRIRYPCPLRTFAFNRVIRDRYMYSLPRFVVRGLWLAECVAHPVLELPTVSGAPDALVDNAEADAVTIGGSEES